LEDSEEAPVSGQVSDDREEQLEAPPSPPKVSQKQSPTIKKFLGWAKPQSNANEFTDNIAALTLTEIQKAELEEKEMEKKKNTLKGEEEGGEESED
jgi:hypothetical protein